MGPQGSRAGVMSKENRGGSNGWMQVVNELLKTDIYKRSQGRIVRQFTCLAIWVAVALAAFQIHLTMKAGRGGMPTSVVYGLPLMVLVVGLWLGFRIVNWPSFADFLIAVEAEMNKVSWPSRTELVRCSMVVIILMFGLTIVLFAYDFILNWLLSRVLQVTIV
jgi:preprotein translocase subunit SecE